MKLENYEVHLPSYSIGDKIYEKIGPVCESYGKRVLVIGGRKALAAAYDKIAAYVAQTNLEIIGTEIYGENCTYATVERLRALPLYQEADMVFGVGGGKALDTVKCLCIPDDKPVFSFPTIASNCAATTSVSIMYNEDGTFLKPHFFIRPVMHAFIDTQIIAQAPSQYMWAGIGDTYAKYYEALSGRAAGAFHRRGGGGQSDVQGPFATVQRPGLRGSQAGLVYLCGGAGSAGHRGHHGDCLHLSHQGLHSRL